MQVTIRKLASKKQETIPVNENEIGMTLLEFLKLKGFPIASSCSGKGICKKCVFNKAQLSCEIKVSSIKDKIQIDYL